MIHFRQPHETKNVRTVHRRCSSCRFFRHTFYSIRDQHPNRHFCGINRDLRFDEGELDIRVCDSWRPERWSRLEVAYEKVRLAIRFCTVYTRWTIRDCRSLLDEFTRSLGHIILRSEPADEHEWGEWRNVYRMLPPSYEGVDAAYLQSRMCVRCGAREERVRDWRPWQDELKAGLKDYWAILSDKRSPK